MPLVHRTTRASSSKTVLERKISLPLNRGQVPLSIRPVASTGWRPASSPTLAFLTEPPPPRLVGLAIQGNPRSPASVSFTSRSPPDLRSDMSSTSRTHSFPMFFHITITFFPNLTIPPRYPRS
ncbi:hypothetical protein LZ32DRAFT_219768 [Colletotrichum eremochloae]|nr:hypothetical protein LZ32DRAFT_219768 [Colletotrichum eremochloae]